MLIVLLLFANFLPSTAHSTMSCVDKRGGTCAIEVRKNPYYFDVSPRCCGQGAATEEVKCPPPEAAKGSLAAGSKFTVEWPARNHATPGQDPDGGITKGVSMYLAPADATTLGQYCGATTVDANCPNKICEGSFGPSTCEGGTNGDMVPCNIECTIPANKAPGKYNILWLWDWRHNDGSMYSACGDITVTAAAAVTPTPPPTNVPVTPTPPPPTTPPPTLPPFTLPPTQSGFTLPPTLPPTLPGPVSCQVPETNAAFSAVRFGIEFINIPQEVPYRECSRYTQEIYYKKDTTTLGIVVIDIIDNNGDWHGKGIEVIPGATNGKTSIELLVWDDKPLLPELGPYHLSGYFVDKTVYDANADSGDYYKDALAVATKTDSEKFCSGCNYVRHCGQAATPSCKTAGELNFYCPRTSADRQECPVDAMMRDKKYFPDAIVKNSASSKFAVVGLISSLLLSIFVQ